MSRKARAAALLALEQRVRARITRRVRALLRRLVAYFGRLVRRTAVATGLQLLSVPDVYNVLRALIDVAKTTIVAIIKAAYLAAASIGRRAAGADLAVFGHQVPAALPKLGRAVEDFGADGGRAFDQALLELSGGIREAFDGVSGRQAGAGRVLTVTATIQRSVRRLGSRVNATGVYATYQGATDAQLATWQHYSVINPAVRLRKRWHAEPDACPDCLELHGAVADLTGVFHASGGSYGPLSGPPLHPSCRCELTLDG